MARAARDAGDGLRVLRYKPERRLVALVHDPGELVHAPGDSVRAAGGLRVVKVYRLGAAQRMLGAQRRLARAGLPVGRLVAADPRWGVVQYRWMPGVTLDAVVSTDAAGRAPAVVATGSLLAELHRTEPDVAFGRADLRGDVLDAVRGISAAVPGLGREARSVAKQVLDQLTGRPIRPRVIHGDFSADQVVVAGRASEHGARLGLLDLDRVCLGDPVADVASWAAAEIAEGRAGLDAAPADVAGGLLAGYLDRADDGAGDEPFTRLNAHTAAALLQRVSGPFRRAEPGWPDRVAELLNSARRFLRPVTTTLPPGRRPRR